MRKLLDAERVAARRVLPETTWPEQVERAARAVFADLLSRPAATVSSPAGGAGDLTVVVGLRGVIFGSLSLCCSSAAAASFTGRMLGVPRPTETQLRISLGELTYQIARTMGKEAAGAERARSDHAGLGGECLVTSPVMAGDAACDCDPPTETHLIAFEFQGLPIWIRFSLYD